MVPPAGRVVKEETRKPTEPSVSYQYRLPLCYSINSALNGFVSARVTG